MDLGWLTAPADEVAAAIARLRRDSRPTWVPTRRQVLVHVNSCLLLWYLCIVLVTFGVRVDVLHGGQPDSTDIAGLTVTMAILAGWLFGTYRLIRWSTRPPSPRARLREWRQTLTALANGFEHRPNSAPTFSSMISTAGRARHGHRRFVAAGIEFGSLAPRERRSSTWHYLAVHLPAPLPHLILDATSNNTIISDLPVRVDSAQRLSLEGDFDRWFHLYTPTRYRSDALYIFTPDVMAALIDNASRYNLEIVDDHLVFFTSSAHDFAAADTWRAVQAILTGPATRLLATARRYRDERVPGQQIPPLLSKINTALLHPQEAWVAPLPRIGPDGRRLRFRNRTRTVWSALGAVGWFTLLTLLYVVPGLFAFAGFMSIVDGW
jgi:hypothetical protein